MKLPPEMRDMGRALFFSVPTTTNSDNLSSAEAFANAMQTTSTDHIDGPYDRIIVERYHNVSTMVVCREKMIRYWKF